MRQRTLGILAGALIVVGGAMNVGADIAAHRTGANAALTPAPGRVAGPGRHHFGPGPAGPGYQPRPGFQPIEGQPTR